MQNRGHQGTALAGILWQKSRWLPALQFRYWYSEWNKEAAPVMHFTHKAGDKLFIDFTGKKLPIIDKQTGEIQQLEVFICVLGVSQYTYVEACESQSKEDFMRCVENALWFYGGLPQALVPDNLKAAVTRAAVMDLR